MNADLVPFSVQKGNIIKRCIGANNFIISKKSRFQTSILAMPSPVVNLAYLVTFGIMLTLMLNVQLNRNSYQINTYEMYSEESLNETREEFDARRNFVAEQCNKLNLTKVLTFEKNTYFKF